MLDWENLLLGEYNNYVGIMYNIPIYLSGDQKQCVRRADKYIHKREVLHLRLLPLMKLLLAAGKFCVSSIFCHYNCGMQSS
jgi:hypothetical protein